MSDDFARVYEESAHRITGPVSLAALDRVGVRDGVRVLDIAAGAGALSVPAAQRGVSVLAVDNAPGMVRRLTCKLAPFPGCEARLMDGEALALPDGGFDAAFSIFGVNLFADWRRGLSEQARVLKPGGTGCVATWRIPPGGGPFVILAQALRAVFPDARPPSQPEGFIALSDPARLADEMRRAGFADVSVEEIEGVWKGPAGTAYLEEVRELHPYMAPYAALGPSDRRKVDHAVVALATDLAIDGKVVMRSPVLLAVGTRA